MLLPALLLLDFSCLAQQKVFVCNYHSSVLSLHYLISLWAFFFIFSGRKLACKWGHTVSYGCVIPYGASCSYSSSVHGLAEAKVGAEQDETASCL